MTECNTDGVHVHESFMTIVLICTTFVYWHWLLYYYHALIRYCTYVQVYELYDGKVFTTQKKQPAYDKYDKIIKDILKKA